MKIGLLPGAHEIGLLLPDALPDAVPDALPDAVPDALPDAVPDALEPGFHCVRAHWIRGFMTFQLARHARTVMLMVPARSSLDCCDREY